MNLTFHEAILNYSRKVGLAESLNSIVLVWSEDYEKEWFWIYEDIPQGAKYFWANRIGKYGKLFKFEKIKGKWKVVEKGKPLTHKSMERINCGPAFQGVPSVLNPPDYTKWITAWSDFNKIINAHNSLKMEKLC